VDEQRVTLYRYTNGDADVIYASTIDPPSIADDQITKLTRMLRPTGDGVAAKSM
jgi:hypothetical protein